MIVKLIRETKIGGVIAFGGSEAVPQVMLNPTYSPIILGQPMELASLLNRLQSVSALPLLASSDFEWGAGMRIAGATKFPRAMAFGAAGDRSWRMRPARSPVSKAAAWACMWISAQWPTSTTTRATR